MGNWCEAILKAVKIGEKLSWIACNTPNSLPPTFLLYGNHDIRTYTSSTLTSLQFAV